VGRQGRDLAVLHLRGRLPRPQRLVHARTDQLCRGEEGLLPALGRAGRHAGNLEEVTPSPGKVEALAGYHLIRKAGLLAGPCPRGREPPLSLDTILLPMLRVAVLLRGVHSTGDI
jgi:hypothetical protein